MAGDYWDQPNQEVVQQEHPTGDPKPAEPEPEPEPDDPET